MCQELLAELEAARQQLEAANTRITELEHVIRATAEMNILRSIIDAVPDTY
jgi:hypothetical protein